MLIGKLPEVEADPKEEPLILVCLGSSIGVLSGLIGIGGGIITVPALTMGLKVKVHRAVGTSLAMIVPPFSVGYVNLLVWACLVVTSILVAQIGARTAHRLPATQLRYIFIALMLYIALRMVGVFEWLRLLE
jgi:hypothetical protein